MSSPIPIRTFYERKFGHCFVSWTIKNYFLAACNPETEIKSRSFLVHSSQDTRWQIGFLVDKTCQVLLRRLSDDADEWINVTWRVKMFDGNRENDFCEDDRFCFQKYSQKAINVPDPSNISQVLDSDLGEVRIEIQMFVNMNATMTIPKLSDTHVQLLVENLKFAAFTQQYCDLTIHLNDKPFRAHRAMLLTRNKTLEQAEGDTNTRKYSIHESEKQAFDCLAAYLYTSDLLYIFETPSVSIYRLIADLDIKELLDAYSEEKITMETIIEATEFVYRRTIPAVNYNNTSPNSNICEPKRGTLNGMDWQLRIFSPEVSEDTETHVKYIYIEASIVNNAEPQDVVVCIKARNEDDPVTVVKREYRKIERDMKLGTKFKRIDNPSVANSLYSLDISLSVHISKQKTTSIITSTCPPVDFKLTNSAAFSILQRNLKDLLEKGLYSDITLSVEGHEFKCHKFLLAARSFAFFRILSERLDASLIEFRNINRDVFGVFLHYLYTGALPDPESGATSDLSVIFLMHLYQLSVNFEVDNLKYLCLERVTNQLSRHNVCCTLVFADERNLTHLKSKALKLFYLHTGTVTHNECRRRLLEKTPELSRSVARLLNRNSCRFDFDPDIKLLVPEQLGLKDMIT